MNFLRLLIVSLVFLLFSCAQKPYVLKEFYAADIEDFLKKMQVYQSLESSISIDYEIKGAILTGDALLKIHKTETLLRVYYMGFPAGELYEKDGEFSSNLLIEKDRIKQILIGIKKGFMWWNGDFEIKESEHSYTLKEKGSDREVVLTKNGFTPVSQTFTFEDQKIFISYETTQKFQTDNLILTMPSNIIVHHKNRALKIKIEHLKLING